MVLWRRPEPFVVLRPRPIKAKSSYRDDDTDDLRERLLIRPVPNLAVDEEQTALLTPSSPFDPITSYDLASLEVDGEDVIVLPVLLPATTTTTKSSHPTGIGTKAWSKQLQLQQHFSRSASPHLMTVPEGGEI